MTPKFFSSWEVFTRGISALLVAANLPKDTEVWRCSDGSYAAGSIQVIDADPEDLEEYTYAGTVDEYSN